MDEMDNQAEALSSARAVSWLGWLALTELRGERKSIL
jgi:hypothetical protein